MQTELQAPGPLGPLSGTLLTPEAAGAPVVLIVPGSGPVDRDGNAGPVQAATYRLLAEALAAHGIATLRIDKRGLHGSREAADPNAVTLGDYARDVAGWVSVLRHKTSAPCVWLLGHSEGGLVAMIAAQAAADICGLILVATPGRPLGAVLREQLQANPANAPLLGEAFAAIARLEAGERVDTTTMHPALLPLFRAEVQGFLIDALAVDPAARIAGCRQPVLIVQGGRDSQVGVGDAERLAQACPAAHLAIIADANHVLKSVAAGDPAANAAAYLDPAAPLASGIAETIAGFIGAARQAA